MKYKQGKYEASLIYTSLLSELSVVRQHGIEKYHSPENWRENPPTDHLDAAIRHIMAHLDGEARDKESGLRHLSHAAVNLMFEIERVAGTKNNEMLALEQRKYVEIICPRCKHKDEYPFEAVGPCTAGCRYIIDTGVEARRKVE